MQSMTVRVPAADLARAMTSMRQWLDLNQMRADQVRLRETRADVVLSVAFSTGGAAEELARQFCGKKVHRP
jgi:hypothetical protein